MALRGQVELLKLLGFGDAHGWATADAPTAAAARAAWSHAALQSSEAEGEAEMAEEGSSKGGGRAAADGRCVLRATVAPASGEEKIRVVRACGARGSVCALLAPEEPLMEDVILFAAAKCGPRGAPGAGSGEGCAPLLLAR